MGSTPHKISASRGASILGLSKYKTQVQIWLELCEENEPGFAEKNGYLLPEQPDNAAIRWGSAFEDAVIKLAEEKSGNNILNCEKYFENGIMTCHIDGQYHSGRTLEALNALHEGKTTNAFTFADGWGTPGTDKIPQEYQIQVQHQLYCTGAEEVIVSVLVFPKRVDEFEAEGLTVANIHIQMPLGAGNFGALIPIDKWATTLAQMGFFHQYKIKRNETLIKIIVEKYNAFYSDYVLKKKPPEAVNYDDIKLLCPAPVGTIIVPEKYQKLLDEHKTIGKEIGGTGYLAKRRDQIKTELLTWARKNEHIIDDDSTEKYIFRSETGDKLGSYNGKMFR